MTTDLIESSWECPVCAVAVVISRPARKGESAAETLALNNTELDLIRVRHDHEPVSDVTQ